MCRPSYRVSGHAPIAHKDHRLRAWRLPGGAAVICGVLLLMMAGASCSQSASDPPSASRDAVIFGRVLSVPGVPSRHKVQPRGVAGVTVSVLNAAGGAMLSSTTSGPDGSFRFVLAPGDYAVAGAGNPHLVHLDPGQHLEVNLRLPTTGSR